MYHYYLICTHDSKRFVSEHGLFACLPCEVVGMLSVSSPVTTVELDALSKSFCY